MNRPDVEAHAKTEENGTVGGIKGGNRAKAQCSRQMICATRGKERSGLGRGGYGVRPGIISAKGGNGWKKGRASKRIRLAARTEVEETQNQCGRNQPRRLMGVGKEGHGSGEGRRVAETVGVGTAIFVGRGGWCQTCCCCSWEERQIGQPGGVRVKKG